MTHRKLAAIAAALICICNHVSGQETRHETILKEWDFRHGHDIEAADGWEFCSL